MTTNTHTSSGTQRRNFLKLMGAGLVSVGVLSASPASLTGWFVAPSLFTQIEFGATLLRGTQTGQLLQSSDQGKTWQALFSFGSHCAVNNLLTLNGQVYAQFVVAGHTFWLNSADAKTWRTLA